MDGSSATLACWLERIEREKQLTLAYKRRCWTWNGLPYCPSGYAHGEGAARRVVPGVPDEGVAGGRKEAGAALTPPRHTSCRAR